jgi:hypothetical protein
VIEFSFIRERIADLYCEDNGRPAPDALRLALLL